MRSPSGETLDDYESTLLAVYDETQKTLEIATAPEKTERWNEKISTRSFRFWKRMLGFLTFGLYRPSDR
jgi:hypothetical protein